METRKDLEQALSAYKSVIAFSSHRDAIKAVLDTLPKVNDAQVKLQFLLWEQW